MWWHKLEYMYICPSVHFVQFSQICIVNSVSLFENLQIQLELFQSERFITPVARFPVTVRHSEDRLYLQATITNEPLLSAMVESCWLSDILDAMDVRKYVIIQNR